MLVDIVQKEGTVRDKLEIVCDVVLELLLNS